MDLLSFTVEICKAIAWPVAAVVIALSFRAQIRALLVRMKKGKLGPAEFEFEQGVRELEETIGAAPDSPSKTPSSSASALLFSKEPRVAILETWLKVDAAAEQLGRKHGLLDDQRPHDIGLVVRRLRMKGVLDWEHEKLYKQLRALRNSAVHEIEFAPLADSVASFVSFAEFLEWHFISLAGEA